ncbi:MAG: glycosyltransferase family 2 protein [Gemmatimonadota bacterium]
MEPVVLSVVVPLRDEGPNLRSLHEEISTALEGIGEPWEVVYVDDGSTDSGPAVLQELAREDPCARVVTLARGYGQSTALVAGAEAARGEWIGTLDADCQNDPRDLVALWREAREGVADVITGYRTRRADGWARRASSWIANSVRNRVSGDRVFDVGCSVRVFPRRALLEAVRFEGMHRFLPTLFRLAGYSVVERPVGHRSRHAGRSKYGIHNRLWRGLADLYVVRRLVRRRVRYELRDGDGG